MQSESEKRWRLVHIFAYHMICQPAEEYWPDADWMQQRAFLLSQVGSNVDKTNWTAIFAEHRQLRPLQDAIAAAKNLHETGEIPARITEYYQRASGI